MAIFTLRNVQFRDIINYPDLEITAQTATFICGESGCGKSTLLKLLNGVISPAGGAIFYCDKHLDEYDPIALRQNVLLCGQSVFLFAGSVRDNFVQFYQYRDLPPLDDEEMLACLKLCAIDFQLDAVCDNMSGGEKQRIFTAICLSFRPDALLLDEPTSALDDATAHAVMANIKTFCRENGMTLLVVSHHKTLAEQYADHLIELTGGNANG
ncbi:MAG: ABC transporter ATP-binding protein [Oscillospiraceae bacterium]|nr:ABC transporter ATP-binding protein [Oscillospiraceae bacterium]